MYYVLFYLIIVIIFVAVHKLKRIFQFRYDRSNGLLALNGKCGYFQNPSYLQVRLAKISLSM